MVVNSLGYTGFSKALVSSLPYLTAVILAIPISWISDKTQKRVLIASLGLLIPGVMLFLLPFVDAPGFKITLITTAMGYYAASFTPISGRLSSRTLNPMRLAQPPVLLMASCRRRRYAGRPYGRLFLPDNRQLYAGIYGSRMHCYHGRRVIIDLRQNKSSSCPALAPSARM